ncbi:MAG: tyrosine-type recombinase/integrase [Clostridiales bacterium]|nr:tyrosine-type recombinase/integrase [Clostridiales bacterium]
MATNQSYIQTKKLHITEITRKIVSELPNDVYDYILALGDSTQPLTRYAYAHDLRLFLSFLQKENPKFSSKDLIAWTSADFQAITARDISMFMDYLGLYFNDNDVMVSNQELGKQRKFYSIRSFFKWLYRQGKISSDITSLIDPPKRHEKPILRLDTFEVKKMLSAVENGDGLSKRQKAYHDITSIRDLAIISLFLGTGIRVSELQGLNVEDLNLEDSSFLVTRKGGNQVILYLPEEIIEPISNYYDIRIHDESIDENENALFISLQKKRMSIRSIENMVKKYAQIAAPLKKRISPHKLRSTFGTNLYNETGDIYLVADVLGHSDINTTRKHYAAMNENRRRYAATKVRIVDSGENTNEEDS